MNPDTPEPVNPNARIPAPESLGDYPGFEETTTPYSSVLNINAPAILNPYRENPFTGVKTDLDFSGPSPGSPFLYELPEENVIRYILVSSDGNFRIVRPFTIKISENFHG